MVSDHKNSTKVEILRKLPFNHESQKGLEEWFKDFKQSVGSYFVKGSAKTGTGFTYKELSILMPHLINAEQDDRDFKAKVQKYFDDISTVIPHDGRKFEIGLELDNNKDFLYSEGEGAMKVYNLPINIEDYVRFRHAKGHPFTADNEEEGKENSLKKFYIVDETLKKQSKLELEELKDKATSKYMEAKGDLTKVEGILAAMGINYFETPVDERVGLLKTAAIERPSDLIKHSDNPDLREIRQIEKLVNSNIIIQEGSNYIFESEIIAKSKNSFVAWLKDAANSEKVAIIKARYQEFAKAK